MQLHLGRKRSFVFGSAATLLAATGWYLWKSHRRSAEQTRQLSELRAESERYQKLAEQIDTSQELERSRLSRRLHDDLGQILTAIKLDLALLSRASTDPEVQKQVQKTSPLLDSGIQIVRNLSTELRPGVLEHLGLSAALNGLATEFARDTGIRCDAVVPRRELNLSSRQRTSLFRITQQALANVAQHANASEVLIELDGDADQAELRVADNGIGFNWNSINPGRSFGLLTIQQYARFAQGTCHWQTTPGAGTQLIVELPITLVESSA